MRKTTDELINELKSAKNIDAFVSENQEEMSDMSLSEYLQELLKKYHLDKSEVFRRAQMTDTNYGYELFRNDVKKPSRDKLIRICMGFPLTIEETQKVLRCGKVRPLYPRERRDAYVMFALKNGQSIHYLNDILYDNGEQLFE